jgi:hypothetical protein
MACCGKNKPRHTKGVSGKIHRNSLKKNKHLKKLKNEQQQNNPENK